MAALSRYKACLGLLAAILLCSVHAEAATSWNTTVTHTVVDESYAYTGQGTGGEVLPKLGAVVKYNMELLAGAAWPLNSTVNITVLDTGTAKHNAYSIECHKPDGSAFTLSVTNSTLANADTLICTFTVNVTNAEQTAGSITGFNVTAKFTDTTNNATASDTLVVPPLDVYTGSALTLGSVTTGAPYIQITAAGTAAGSAQLPMLNATLTYTVTLKNGAKAVPAGSLINITANNGGTVACADNTTMGTNLTAPWPSASMLNCTVTLVVTAAHKTSGSVPPITVTVATIAATTAYYVPALVMPSVPVAIGAPQLAVVPTLSSTDVALYKQVGSVKIPKAGAVITYSITLINGDTALPASTLALQFNSTGGFPGSPSPTCTLADSTAVDLSAGLNANTAVLCSFTTTVTTTQAAANPPVLPGWTLIANNGTTQFATALAAAVNLYSDPAVKMVNSVVDTTDATKYIDVNGKPLAMVGSLIKYQFTVTNGAQEVPASTAIEITSNLTTATNLLCKDANQASFVLSASRTSPLAAYAVITCTMDYTVLAADKSNGAVSMMRITATVPGSAYPTTPLPYADFAAVPVHKGQPIIQTSFDVTSANSTYQVVNGNKRALAGATVTYTIILINGDSQVNTSASPVLKTVIANEGYGQPGVFPPANFTNCKLSNTATGTAYTGGTTALPANTAVVCIFDVTVNASDIALKKLPKFNVTAPYTTTPPTAMVDNVWLYTTPRVDVTITFKNTDTTTTVNGTALYGLGSTATYTITLANGAVPVPSGTALDLQIIPVSGTAPGTLTSCTVPPSTLVGLPKTQGISDYAELKCLIVHSVTPEDINNAALPSFVVLATVGSNQYVNMTVRPQPLFTPVPCDNCRVCLASMTDLMGKSLNVTDPQILTGAFTTLCKQNYNVNLCDLVVNKTLASPTGNFGKRAGLICKTLGACNTAQMAAACLLGTTASLVPEGKLDVCSVPGTNGTTSLAIPNVVKSGTNLTAGFCFNSTGCPADKVCDTTTDTGLQCVCSSSTGEDTCTPYHTCVDSPCTKCRNCIAAASAFADLYQAVKNSTQVAAAFKAECLKSDTLDVCSTKALLVEASYQGNLAKRPGLMCNSLCSVASLPTDCVIRRNSSANLTATPVFYPGNYSKCTVDAAKWGSTVPGIFTSSEARTAAKPNGSCTADAGCNANETCSLAAGQQMCFCEAATGMDNCTTIGFCKQVTCETCAACLSSVQSFVKDHARIKDPETIANDWINICPSTLGGAIADCTAAKEAIRTSPYGNVGKRAANLCSKIYKCSAATCAYNASNAINGSDTTGFVSQVLDVCTVEGVATANRVPGVQSNLDLPNNTCSLANTACGNDTNLMCDLTTTAGVVCQCDSSTGGDTCQKYSPCILTPCKLCSNCLTDMTGFASAQQFAIDSALGRSILASNFSTYCSQKQYNAAACAAVAATINSSSTPISYGKRAATLCTAIGLCNTTAMAAGCILSSTVGNVTLTANGTLELCTVEGLADGRDLLGYARGPNPSLPPGTCDSDASCGNVNSWACDKSLGASFCSCYLGKDSCRTIGKCVLKPCPSCEACMTNFMQFVNATSAFSTAASVAYNFLSVCQGTNRSDDSCNSAALAIASSYKGNGGRRAGSICKLLGECMPASMGACNMTVDGRTGTFNLCTKQGVSAGDRLAVGSEDYAVGGYAYTKNMSCTAEADCVGGKYCSYPTTATTWMCDPVTGQDAFKPLGNCTIKPCDKCQQCLDDMAVRIAPQLAKNVSDRVYDTVCDKAGCTDILTQYVTPLGASKLFGLRAGALCSALQQCTNLPSTCTLRAKVGSQNLTGQALDLCTAEGVAAGTILGGPYTGACLLDADCTTDKQCDLASPASPKVYRCSGGLDTDLKYGKCVAKPQVSNVTLSPCERCDVCVDAISASVEVAALNMSVTKAQLGNNFYAACSAGNYSLVACRTVQNMILDSYNGNLARRAGALCLRLGECSQNLKADSNCVLTSTPTKAVVIDAADAPAAGATNVTVVTNVTAGVNTTVNSTVVTNGTAGSNTTVNNTVPSPTPKPVLAGLLDVCTVEGVVNGMPVMGITKFGKALNNTCVFDADCGAGNFCSSDATVQVCRCVGGIDSCDNLPTCKPIPQAPAPPPRMTSCQKCTKCIAALQGFVLDTATDNQALAAKFSTYCQVNMTLNTATCKPVGDAIMNSKQGTLAKRAGALCNRLGLCPSDLQTDASCMLNGTTAYGKLNLCAAEGVGAAPAKAAAANTTCLEDADCLAPNTTTYDGSLVCSFANATTDCTCDKGVDVCVQRGSCVGFCSAKAGYIDKSNDALNAIKCDGPFADCGTGMQCLPTSQCQVLSCNDKTGITKTACYGFCMVSDRKVLSAKMQPNGKTITIVLNTAAAPASLACASLFDAQSMTMLKKDAWCTVQGQTLDITLGPSATLLPGTNTLSLSATQTVLADLLNTAARFVGTNIPVATCGGDCAKPTVKIFGPKIVSAPCVPSAASDIIFDASLSTDASGRPLKKVVWAYSGADAVVATAINVANTANDGTGAYRLVLPGSQLANLVSTTYTIQVTVTNYLDAWDTASLTFTKAGAPVPLVIPVTTGDVPFVISEGVKVATQLVATSVCQGSEVEYLWESVDATPWAAISTGYDRKDLVLPGPVPDAVAGNPKIVRLTANFKGAADKATFNVTLRPQGSPLVAQLRGPSGDVVSTRSIVLNATGSFDPDDPQCLSGRPLALSWECMRADFPQPCFTGLNSNGVQSGRTWTLPASLLAADIEHTFVVTIQRTMANGTIDTASPAASASVALTSRSASLPTGRIRRVCGGACPLRHSVDEPLTLAIALDAGSEAATVTWTVEQTGYSASGSVFEVSGTNLPQFGFITVKAVVALSGAQSTTKMTIPINGKPQCTASSCPQVTPSTGVFPSARFAVDAGGFTDDQPGMRFDFGLKDAKGARQVVSSSAAPTFVFSGLPVGTTTLYVCAVDTDGAKQCSDKDVTVTAAPADFKLSDAVTGFDVIQLKAAGDVSVLAAGAQALQTLSKYAAKPDVAASQSAAEQEQVQYAIAAKTGALISTLASSADSYVNDQQTMQQVVSAVAALSKASNKVSQDSKQKMLNVANSGIASAKLSKKPVSPPEASRLWAVIAAGNSMQAVCKVAATCSPTAGGTRHLLQQTPEWYTGSQLADTGSQLADTPAPEAHVNRALLQAANVTANATANATGANTTVPATPPPPPPMVAATDVVPPYTAPYVQTASTVSNMLVQSASPAVSYLSGGDNGLYVSVAKRLGRAYTGAAANIIVGPQIEASGDAADAASGDNPTVLFSAPLTGQCVDEEGSSLGNAPCSEVVVPVQVTYTPDTSSMLKPVATGRKLAAAALPAGFAAASGAVTLNVAGSAADGSLPCGAGCTATIAQPIYGAQEADMLYYCTQIVDGQYVLGSTSAVTASETVPSVPTVLCPVSKSGTYLVGKALDPNRQLGVNTTTENNPLYANYAGLLKPGEPLSVKLSFDVASGFVWTDFISNKTKVDGFVAMVKSLLMSGISGQIAANAIKTEDITVSSLREGSIVADVSIATTGITDAAVMDKLVAMMLVDPTTLLATDATAWGTFLAEYKLTGVVTAERITALKAAMNVPAIVGGVVGGVGGALLIAAIALILIKRRRASGVEPRNRQLLGDDTDNGV